MSAKAPRPHGRTKYVVEKCRCDVCRAAVAAYERERRRRVEPAYVDAAEARAHVRWLGTQGVGWQRVAECSGVPAGSVSRLLYGQPGRVPSKRIRQSTAERLLAVTPADRRPRSTIPPGPTWELVDRLLAAGVTRRAIAERLGQRRTLQLSRVAVTARHAKTIADMAAELDAGTLTIERRTRWGTTTVTLPPPADVITRHDIASRSASRAEKRMYRSIAAGAPVDITCDDADRFIVAVADALEERIDSTTWTGRAACRPHPTWLFFPAPGDHKTIAQAKTVCATCPVVAECLTTGADDHHGIRGGLTAAERDTAAATLGHVA